MTWVLLIIGKNNNYPHFCGFFIWLECLIRFVFWIKIVVLFLYDRIISYINYNSNIHQIHIEEYLYYKRLVKNKKTI